CVGLEEIVAVAGAVAQAPTLGADDAGSHGTGQAERRPDRQHAVALVHLAAIAQFQVRELGLGFDANGCEVGASVTVDIGALQLTAVLQRARDLVCAVDDVVVRQDHALWIDDEAGAEALRRHELTLLERVALELFHEAAKLFGYALFVELRPAARLIG